MDEQTTSTVEITLEFSDQLTREEVEDIVNRIEQMIYVDTDYDLEDINDETEYLT